jgi:hypothetical protein
VPVLLALGVALVAGVALLALPPLTLFLRYRAGTARRRARGWVAALNLAAFALSAALFLGGAAIAGFWEPRALPFAGRGLAAGIALGLIGLWLSRFEATPSELHYTPNRWLVLAITLVVTGRILYGFWRGWHTWQAASGQTSWLVAFGVAGSLAAGALVLGYYLSYWAGLWWLFRRHRRRAVPVRR